MNYTNKKSEIYANILEITASIEKIYHELMKLEKNNQKNTDLFKKYVDYLKMIIEIEEEKYSMLSHSFIRETIEALEWQYSSLTTQTSIKHLINYTNNSMLRIFKKLNQELTKGPEIEKIMYLSPDDDKVFGLDISLAMLYFLNQVKKDELEEIIKNYINNSKYRMAMVDTNVENHLIATNFADIEQLIINSKQKYEMFGLCDNYYKTSSNDYAYLFCLENCLKILNNNEKNYNKTELSLDVMIRKEYIRASLLLLEDENALSLRKRVLEFAYNEKMHANSDNDKYVKIIMEVFSTIEKEKQKCKIMSIRE